MARSHPGLLTYRQPDGEEQHFTLDQPDITLGRSDGCTITLPVATVSRTHARIVLQQERYLLRDEDSANGTFVNGTRIDQEQQLTSGDTIWLGTDGAVLQFADPEETIAALQGASHEPLLIDEQARVVQLYGAPVPLSPLEYRLLLHLARNPGAVCTRESCFLAAWGQPYDHATCEDALNACVAKLRRNLRAIAEQTGHQPPAIKTLQRVGFRLDADATILPAAEPQERALGE